MAKSLLTTSPKIHAVQTLPFAGCINFNVLDVESAILTGRIDQVLTHDPRGTRSVVIGTATDQTTPVGVVGRFVEHDQLLIVTVYEIK